MNDYTKIIIGIVFGMAIYASSSAVVNREKEIYTIPVACSNCQYHGDVKISIGTEVSGGICPHCGTKRLAANFWDQKDIEKKEKEDVKK